MKQNILILTCGFILVLLLFPACSFLRKPVECVQIQENELQTLLESGPVSLKNAQQWLNNSSFKGVEIRSGGKRDNGTQDFSWIQNEIEYHAYFQNDTLMRIQVFWKSRYGVALEPTGDEILSCLGTPDLYQASYRQDIEAKILNIGLWYLEQGVVVSALYSDTSPDPPTIDGDIVMTFMTIVIPGTEEEMIKNVYTHGDSDQIREDILNALKPWPGTWEQVIVDTN